MRKTVRMRSMLLWDVLMSVWQFGFGCSFGLLMRLLLLLLLLFTIWCGGFLTDKCIPVCTTEEERSGWGNASLPNTTLSISQLYWQTHTNANKHTHTNANTDKYKYSCHARSQARLALAAFSMVNHIRHRTDQSYGMPISVPAQWQGGQCPPAHSTNMVHFGSPLLFCKLIKRTTFLFLLR